MSKTINLTFYFSHQPYEIRIKPIKQLSNEGLEGYDIIIVIVVLISKDSKGNISAFTSKCFNSDDGTDMPGFKS